METQFVTPQGKFELQRIPLRKNEKLRAWDAADEYLLQHIAENHLVSKGNKLLILNDSFGALAVALSQYKPVAISDSYLSQLATRQNYSANKLMIERMQLSNSLEWPTSRFDLVLIKIPKTLALLEDQLIRLQAVVTSNSIILAAGMIKTINSSVWQLMEKYLGPTVPSLARKKARLIFVRLRNTDNTLQAPYPVYYQLEKTHYRICNHANVFSRDKLDIGTRFLLENLPNRQSAKDIVDLGCGNGVVGLMLAQTHQNAVLHFIDESYMAIASARENVKAAFPGKQARFCVADGLSEYKTESVDLIVCNPPFHQQHTVSTQLAISLFKQSKNALRKGGRLWVIGNRHLGYYQVLNQLFSRCQQVACNSKFVIWQMEK